ncbi:hypothetical protein HanRHA438_Chr07g0305521 [Helianthus annuus]|uniref:Uncharacterized protein n=1 Tax=Helianthus annuus TaxID=4232 RepID=A0A9K3ILK2_HELAN|nr:hypothetical protein HanXRQr2_Chr07g0295301 [Helianthus annuus]KAJ0550212.1 hypothetical protein HanHA300_Chr07g0242821 [Helianthus annuus]KAJ0556859.1 hypothetical protein HanIR_Chr07g0318591 [Helianthus annuus]KAJ0731285.1 hypothetical protein HanOQP8_Chr07g0250201 [Helianthus annuus]KAJ0907999.1 hypothetical protein HanRHA438_Chr07g0305521 [Helianthus annuus]
MRQLNRFASKPQTVRVAFEIDEWEFKSINGSLIYHSRCNSMKFLDWYLKIGVVSAAIGGSMEYFMIKTGFCSREV